MSLVDIVVSRAESRPRSIAFEMHSADTSAMSNIDLFTGGMSVATTLRTRAAPGDRVLILHPEGLDYVRAVFGTLLAGMVAVPAYPPRRNRSLDRLNRIAVDCDPAVVLATAPIIEQVAGRLGPDDPLRRLPWLAVPAVTGVDDSAGPALPGPDDLAVLQYTSGSTASPRGVKLTHGNLMANLSAIATAFGHDETSRGLVWLPPYHDMGLIGGLFQPVFQGFPVTLMSPSTFLHAPVTWLRAISETGATSSGGPNFAYDHCLRQIDDAQAAGLDLSRWRVAFNGAEPVRTATMRRFAERFAPHGFRPDAFLPCYGLAESTLIVAAARRSDAIGPAARRPDATARIATVDDGVAASGRGVPGQTLLIVDPQTHQPADSGEIWLQGPSVAAGYWRHDELTAETFRATLADGTGPFLRTGDLGHLDDAGDLVVSGRLKDLLIVRGRNHHPHDVEYAAIGTEPWSTGAAAFTAQGRVVLVVELHRRHRGLDQTELATGIRRRVMRETEVRLDEVVFVAGYGIPRTTSGKIQRYLCRERYRAGELTPLGVNRIDTDVATAGPAALVAARVGVPAGDLDPDEPLYRLGLDSLAAMELGHEIERRHGVTLAIDELLDGLTLAQLAARIDEAGQPVEPPVPADPTPEPPVPADPMPEPTVTKVGPTQAAMWFMHRLAPHTDAYVHAVALRIRGGLDTAALGRAVDAVWSRHAALRMSYRQEGAEVVAYLPTQRSDAMTLAPLAPHSEQRLRSEATRPFDLTRDAPARATLFPLTSGEAVLLLVAHQIAVDFWSLEVVLEEILTVYREGSVRSLPVAPSYQLALSAPDDGRFARAREYWDRTLVGDLPVLRLPPEPVRRDAVAPAGVHTFRVGAELADALRGLATRHATTVFTVLLTGYHVLLHRWTGDDRVVVGTPVAARVHSDLAGLVAGAANSVALLADFTDDPHFADLLARNRTSLLGALRHQDYPFPLVVQQLRAERTAGRTPVYQTMFTFHRDRSTLGLGGFVSGLPGHRVDVDGLELTSVPLAPAYSPFGIALTIADGAGGLTGRLTYDTTAVTADTAATLADGFVALLEGAARQSGHRVSALPLTTVRPAPPVAPRAATTHAWRSPLELVRAQAARTPEATAAVDADGRCDYRGLLERADALRDTLRAHGVGPESVVAVFTRPGIAHLASMLAVLGAGAVWLPLDPALPAARLRHMVSDAGARLAIADTALPWHTDLPVVSPASRVAVPSGNDDTAVTADSAACVLYTSGSTGAPKGVVVTHGNIAAHVGLQSELLGLSGSDAVLLVESFGFAAAIRQVFTPLSCGATVVVATGEQVSDVRELTAVVERERVSVLSMTPSLLRRHLDALLTGDPSRRERFGEHLRWVLAASESLPGGLARQWTDELKHPARLLNMFGHTEIGGIALVHPVAPDHASAQVPVGRPLPGVVARVVDTEHMPVPAGFVGELLLEGPVVGRGYLGAPGATASSFGPAAGGRRFYRTGDLVRRRSDGVLEFVGRADQQVKIRGVRIETAEVEAVLLDHTGVREAVVVAHADGDTAQLTAYLVCVDPRPTVGELRRFVHARLPEAMVPTLYTFLDELPRGVTGKVDRGRLPAPERYRPDVGVAFTAPADAMETSIAGLWQRALRLDQVGVDDNFFDLGGSSLTLMQVHQLLRDELAVDVPMVTLFEHPTVRSLAAHVTGGAAARSPHLDRARRAAARRRTRLNRVEDDRTGGSHERE